MSIDQEFFRFIQTGMTSGGPSLSPDDLEFARVAYFSGAAAGISAYIQEPSGSTALLDEINAFFKEDSQPSPE